VRFLNLQSENPFFFVFARNCDLSSPLISRLAVTLLLVRFSGRRETLSSQTILQDECGHIIMSKNNLQKQSQRPVVDDGSGGSTAEKMEKVETLQRLQRGYTVLLYNS
jgi:hypothetical protein